MSRSILCFPVSQSILCFPVSRSILCFPVSRSILCFPVSRSILCFPVSRSILCFPMSRSILCFPVSRFILCFPVSQLAHHKWVHSFTSCNNSHLSSHKVHNTCTSQQTKATSLKHPLHFELHTQMLSEVFNQKYEHHKPLIYTRASVMALTSNAQNPPNFLLTETAHGHCFHRAWEKLTLAAMHHVHTR